MPWDAPYDPDGKLAGAAQTFTLGTGGSAHAIRVTTVNPSVDQTILRGTDSGNWNPTRKKLFPSKLVLMSDTKFTIEGYFYFETTPDWVIDLVFSGGSIPLSYKPDGVNELFGGDCIIGNFSGTFPTEELCTFSLDVEISGDPDIGAVVTEPV